MEFDNNSPLVMTIKILNATNLKGSKPAPNTFMRVQFADFEKDGLINTFTSKMISLSLLEALPKEKSSILGSCEISLFKKFLHYYDRSDVPIPDCPLSFTQTISISYINSKLLINGQELPSVTFSVTLSRPLLSPSVLQASIFLSVKLEDLFPVPEEWSLKEGNEKDLQSNLYHYCIAINFPGVKEDPRVMNIGGGVLGMIEAPNQGDFVQSIPQTISVLDVKSDAKLSESKSSLAKSTEKLLEIKAVRWNGVHNIWLGPTALEKIRTQSGKTLELELYRVPQPKFSGLSDTVGQKFKAKAKIDLQFCLKPTVIGLKGRYSLEIADINYDLQDKGKNTDPYKSIGSSIGLILMFSAPMVSKKKLAEVSKSVQEYIPRRVLSTDAVHQQKVTQASAEYKSKIKEIVEQLVFEYQEALKLEMSLDNSSKGSLLSQTSEEEGLRKRLFLYHLNQSGAYFDMKEKLKAAVVQIVQEKFQNKSPFTDKSYLRQFLSELYAYLSEEMHSAINTMYLSPTKSPVENNSFVKYYDFAKDAEWNQNITKAGKYFRERIAKYEDNLTAWFDYSSFCMRNRMEEMGIEALKEIIGRDDKYVKALIAYSMICFANEKYEESKTFLQQAIQIEPNNIVANCMMGLFLDVLNEFSESGFFLNHAAKLSQESHGNKKGHLILTAEFALELNCGIVIDKVLSMEILSNPKSFEPYLLFVKLDMQNGRFSKAEKSLTAILSSDKSSVEAWVALGHLYFIQNKFNEAKIAYDTITSLSEVATDILDRVYIRLGDIHLKMAQSSSKQQQSEFENFARISKDMYLRACEANRESYLPWVGAGKACFALEEYDEAENAFCEANFINNKDGDIWAQMALLSLAMKREVEADQAISQALRLGIDDIELLCLTGKSFLTSNHVLPAIELLTLAKDASPDNEEILYLHKKALGMKASPQLDHSNTRTAGLAM